MNNHSESSQEQNGTPVDVASFANLKELFGIAVSKTGELGKDFLRNTQDKLTNARDLFSGICY